MKFSREKSAEIIEQAIEMLKDGVKRSVIQERFSVSKTWLRRHLASSGYAHKLMTSPEMLNKARDLRSQGVRWKVIERKLRVNWLTLSKEIYRQNRIAMELNQ